MTNLNDANTTILVAKDHHLQAVFSIIEHELKVIPSGGGIALGSGSYGYGNSVNISAIANAGYQFLYWSGKGVEYPFNPSTTAVIFGDTVIEAKFSNLRHNLQIFGSLGGVHSRFG